MNSPSFRPDNIPQIDAMRMGIDYRFQVKLRQFSAWVRPLTIQETLEVAAEVQERFHQLPPKSQNSLSEHVLLAQLTLEKASTSDIGKTDSQITGFIVQRMTPDEIQYLHKQYVAACDRANPCLEMMTADELRAVVEELKKSPKGDLASALIELPLSQLVGVAQYFLAQSD